MFSFKEDNGDLVIKQDLEYINDDEDVLQSLRALLSTRLTEFFLDTELGIDLEPFTDKSASNQERELALVETLYKDDRVEDVIDVRIEIDRESRQAEVTGTAIAQGKMIDLAEMGVLYG